MGCQYSYPAQHSWSLSLWNWPCVALVSPPCFSSPLLFRVKARNTVRSRESTVTTIAVVEMETNAEARELSRGDTNEIGQVVHVVKNCNDPNAISLVVHVVKNFENPERPKIPLLMEATNAFIFLYYCDFLTLITSGILIGKIVNRLWGVDLLRCTIILTNE